MSEPSDKELAGFIMGLLKMEPCIAKEIIGYIKLSEGQALGPSIQDVFEPEDNHDRMVSAFIRDLIEEEMVSRSFYSFRYKKVSGERWELKMDWADTCFIEIDKSKTRAVALAAYQALGGKP